MTTKQEDFKLKVFYENNGLYFEYIIIDTYKYLIRANGQNPDRSNVDTIQLQQADK